MCSLPHGLQSKINKYFLGCNSNNICNRNIPNDRLVEFSFLISVRMHLNVKAVLTVYANVIWFKFIFIFGAWLKVWHVFLFVGIYFNKILNKIFDKNSKNNRETLSLINSMLYTYGLLMESMYILIWVNCSQDCSEFAQVLFPQSWLVVEYYFERILYFYLKIFK